MEALSIRSRIAGLQVPISQIQTLALATNEMIEELFPNGDQEAHRIGNHLINLVDLIGAVARQASDEAAAIEVDASYQTGGR